MAVLTKSIYEPQGPEDGLRVLTTQYWPRGIKREKVDRYIRLLGPTRDLLHAFKDSAIDWEEYTKRYLLEIGTARAQEEIDLLADLSAGQNVTVMCVCKDDRECHRRLLKKLIEERKT